MLVAAESIITYRRRYRDKAQVGTVLDLLVLDEDNPRSLAYQLDRLDEDLLQVPGGGGASGPERVLDRVATRLRRFDSAELAASDDTRSPAELAEALEPHATSSSASSPTPSRPPTSATSPRRSRCERRDWPDGRYRVVHSTEYVYDDDVTGSYGQAHLQPRDLPHQTCRSSSVYVDPTPEDVRDHTDHFGNLTTYFHVAQPHTRLTVTATSLVDVTPPTLPDGLPRASRGRTSATRWPTAPARTPRRASTSWPRRSSGGTSAVQAYAAPSFAPRPADR